MGGAHEAQRFLSTCAAFAAYGRYGNDVIDYELDFDLRNLWKESLETIDLMGDGVSAEPDLADRMLAKNGVTPNAQHVQVAGTGTEASVDTPAAMDLKGGEDDGHEEGRT